MKCQLPACRVRKTALLLCCHTLVGFRITFTRYTVVGFYLIRHKEHFDILSKWTTGYLQNIFKPGAILRHRKVFYCNIKTPHANILCL